MAHSLGLKRPRREPYFHLVWRSSTLALHIDSPMPSWHSAELIRHVTAVEDEAEVPSAVSSKRGATQRCVACCAGAHSISSPGSVLFRVLLMVQSHP
jgi:hypothetical protein